MDAQIQFEPTSAEAELLFEKPSPASEHLPTWYRNMALHLDGQSETGLAPDSIGSSNLTLRGCMPFLDALSAGYMFALPFDIEIRRNDNGAIGIRWATNIDFIGQHSLDQAPGLPIPSGMSPNILKWNTGWRIITPPGYSTLFTHPLNHFNLPFITFSGIVDTDAYGLGVQFPFRLEIPDEEITILEKGTPICQIIPFKRTNWTSKRVVLDEGIQKKNVFALKSKIIRSYQRQFWKKKSYK